MEIQSIHVLPQELMGPVANSMPPSTCQDANFDNFCFIKMLSGCAEGIFAGCVDLIDRSSRTQEQDLLREKKSSNRVHLLCAKFESYD